jgi:hypothetical protein
VIGDGASSSSGTQFLRQQSFSMLLAIAGIGIWLGFVSFAVVLAGGKR